MKIKYIITAVALLLFTMPAFSDVKVISARGETGVMEKGKLQPLKAGMQLKEGVSIITGVNSEVVLNIDSSKVTIRSLTTMKISSNKRTSDTAETRLAVRRGTVLSEVNKIQGVKTRFKIATPVATSSVRGTNISCSVSPVETTFITLRGEVEVLSSSGGSPVSLTPSFTYTHTEGEKAPSPLTEKLKWESQTSISDKFSTKTETVINNNFTGEFTNVNQVIETVIPVKPKTNIGIEFEEKPVQRKR